jgi:hypothetical protein
VGSRATAAPHHVLCSVTGPLVAACTEKRAKVGERAEMAKLVRVDHRANGLDDAVDDVECKDVVEEEDGALDRRQLLEQDEKGERERVGLLGVLGGVESSVAVVREQRLGERRPLAMMTASPGPRSRTSSSILIVAAPTTRNTNTASSSSPISRIARRTSDERRSSATSVCSRW